MRRDILPLTVLVGGPLALAAGIAAIAYVLATPMVAWGGAGDGPGNRESASYDRSDPGNRLPHEIVSTYPEVTIIHDCNNGTCSVMIVRNDFHNTGGSGALTGGYTPGFDSATGTFDSGGGMGDHL